MNTIVTNGCSGNCCESFSLPFSPEDFKTMLQVLPEDFVDSEGFKRTYPKDPFLPYIADMLIPLGLNELNPNGNSSNTRFVLNFLKKNGKNITKISEASEEDLSFLRKGDLSFEKIRLTFIFILANISMPLNEFALIMNLVHRCVVSLGLIVPIQAAVSKIAYFLIKNQKFNIYVHIL